MPTDNYSQIASPGLSWAALPPESVVPGADAQQHFVPVVDAAIKSYTLRLCE
jgi:hypothetical protein